MSLFPVSASPAAAYAPGGVHPHGHKKGAAIESQTDAAAPDGARAPAGSTQNLFSRLFTSLQQTAGALPAVAATRIAKI